MVDSHAREYNPSDRKKMLALPFHLAKQSELPEPKKGQKEWEIFYNLYGVEYDQFNELIFDKEDKITEFNYENFIPKHILQTMDTESSEFKNLVKKLNLYSRTAYEKHQDNQKQFRQLMPILSRLDMEESEILMHLI
jgi:hypothetical protein